MAEGRFAASVAAFVAQAKGAEQEYLRVFSTNLLVKIIDLSAIDTSWLRNHWRASLTGEVGPLEPRPPRKEVPRKPAGDDSIAACAPVFAEFKPGQTLLIANTATSEDDGYYPILTEYGGPRNPAHFTLTQVTVLVPEIAAEALAAVRAQSS